MIVDKKHITWNGQEIVIFYIEGLVKLGESGEFFVSAAMQEGNPKAIFDLTKIDYIDSTGIGEWVGYLRRWTEAGRELRLVGVTDRIKKLLKLAHFEPKIFASK